MNNAPDDILDTIVAAATPPGKGGVGIVRLSGPATEHIARHMLATIPSPRYATHCNFFDADGAIIDGQSRIAIANELLSCLAAVTEGTQRSKAWLYWVPAIAVMAIIFVLSSQSGLRVSDDAAVDKTVLNIAAGLPKDCVLVSINRNDRVIIPGMH